MAPPKNGKRTSAGSRSHAPKRSKPGLALTTESPARPLSSFTGFRSGSPSAAQGGPRLQGRPLEAHDASSSAALSTKGKGKAASTSSSHTLWVDDTRPCRKADVAVHKKKVEQVEAWLRDALDGSPSIRKYRRILVLSGPSGSGKSALVRALAHEEELDFRIVEWTDESRQSAAALSRWDRGRGTGLPEQESSSSAPTQQTRFSSFLSQASRFRSLNLDDAEGLDESQNTQGSSSMNTKGYPRQIVVLDDLPNLQYEPARVAFQAALSTFVLSASRADSVPLVLILSDSTPRLAEWDASNSAQGWRERADETLSVRNVIPEEVRNHAGYAHIAFNSIAATFMRKALLSILSVRKQVDAASTPAPTSSKGKELIESLIAVANGDIRSAINTLQLTLTQSAAIGAQGTKRFADGSTRKKGKGQSSDHTDPLTMTAGREASLAVFHALGKVLYNKREGDPVDGKTDGIDGDTDEDGEPEQGSMTWLAKAIGGFMGKTNSEYFDLPHHLLRKSRRKSKVDLDKLWRSMPMDASTLQVFLHQNYTPFCSEIEQCESLIDHLSFADTLKPVHEERSHASLTQHYAFLISTHGSLMSLPSPMPRNKDQRFRGMAFFHSIRRTRQTQETLRSISASLQKPTDGSLRSSLAGLGVDQLACEALPIVAKCRKLSKAAHSCVELKMFGRINSESLARQEESEDNLDEDEVASASLNIADHDEQLYDANGKRVSIQLLEGSQSQDDVAAETGLAEPAERNSVAGRASDIDEQPDEDEIVDSD